MGRLRPTPLALLAVLLAAACLSSCQQGDQAPTPKKARSSRPAARCKVHIQGGMGRGGTDRITHASFSCKGTPVVMAANDTLLSPFLRGASGVVWDQDGCEGQYLTCLLTICGSTHVAFEAPVIAGVRNEYLSRDGGILCASRASSMELIGGRFSNNLGPLAWATDSASLAVKGCSFEGHASRANGGCLIADAASALVVVDSSFSNSSAAEDGGAIHVSGSARASINGSTFASVRAKQSGGVLYAEGAAVVAMRNCSVRNSRAGDSGGAVYMEGSRPKLSIVDCTGINSTGRGGGGFIALSGNATAAVRGCSFVGGSTGDGNNQGGAVYAEASVRLLVSNSAFVRCTATSDGGALYLGGRSSLVLHSSRVINCTANGGGGGGLSAQDRAVVRISSCLFEGCSTQQGFSGGGLHALGFAKMGISHSSIVGSQTANDGGGMFAGDNSSVVVEDCLFSGNMVQQDYSGGGLALFDNATGVVSGSRFVANAAGSGGGAYSRAANFSGCVFERNVAYAYGGAGLVIGCGSRPVVAVTNSTFIANQALKDDGGGLGMLSGCPGLLLAVQGSRFINNTVFYAAGAGLSVVDGSLNLTDCLLANNTAFGDGGGLKMAYGSANGSSTLVVRNSTFASNHATFGGGAYLMSGARAVVTDGTRFEGNAADTDGGGLYVERNATLTITGGTLLLNNSAKGDGDELHAEMGAALHFGATNINASSRGVFQEHSNCTIGEVLQQGVCQACPDGLYSLDPHPPEGAPCQPCPANANCSGGGASISPLPGFWHSHPYSIQMHACPRQESCLGGGVCSPGFEGPVCGVCSEGHGSLSPFRCGPCMQPGAIVGLYVSAGVAVFLVFSLLVHTTLRDNASTGVTHRALTSEYLKLLVRHVQLLWIVSNLRVHWPGALAAIFKAAGWFFEAASSQVVSLDCLGPSGHLPLPMRRLLVYLLAGPVMLVALLLGRLLIAAVGKRRGSGCARSGSSTHSGSSAGKRGSTYSLRVVLTVCNLVVLFLMYPLLVRSGLSLFACLQLDDPSAGAVAFPQYLVANASFGYSVLDVTQACYSGWHRGWALGLGIPLVLFCLAAPLGIAGVLYCNRSRLGSQGFKQQYGFVYNLYRRKRFYWEACSMLMIFVLVAISVFTYTLGSYFSVVLLNIAFATSFFILYMFSPHALPDLNRTQLLSTGCLYYTSCIALTLFDVDTRAPPVYGNVMAIVAVIANLLFLLWCLYRMLVLRGTGRGWLQRARARLKSMCTGRCCCCGSSSSSGSQKGPTAAAAAAGGAGQRAVPGDAARAASWPQWRRRPSAPAPLALLPAPVVTSVGPPSEHVGGSSSSGSSSSSSGMRSGPVEPVESA